MQRIYPVFTVAKSLSLRSLYLPIWWYTKGLKERVVIARQDLRGCGKLLQLKILFKNLFTPLYGFRDWETRFVSFIIRPGHFVFILVISLAHLLMYAIPIVLWIVLPPIVLYSIGYQLDLVYADIYAPLWSLVLFLFS